MLDNHPHAGRSVLLFLSLLFASSSVAQTVGSPADDSVHSPVIANATTIVLVKVKPAQLQVPNWLESEMPLGQQNRFAAVQSAVTTGLAWLKQVSGSDPFYVAADVPYSQAQPVVRMIVRHRDSSKLDRLKQQLARYSSGAPVVEGDFLVASPTHSFDDVEYALDPQIMPASRPSFSRAAEAVASYPVQILIVPPRYVWDTLDELLPELPAQLGGGPTDVLTKGLRWAAIGVDPNKTEHTVTIQSDSAQAAEAFASRLPTLLADLLAQTPEYQRTAISPFSEAMLHLMKTRVVEDQVHVSFGTLDQGESPASILDAILKQVTGPLNRAAKRNRMRAIVLGILNYESANSSFPPGEKVRNENGRSQLSWRVHILPFLGVGEAKLYAKFHLDEPWDSPHNLELVAEMPQVFNAYPAHPLSRPGMKPGYTPFLAPVGEGTIFGGDKVTKIRAIKDGTSITLAIVEVKAEFAVPWTAPQDYDFDVEDPGSGLAWGADDATGVMACDGAWHLLRRSLSDAMLLRLFQMDDGLPTRLE